MTLEGKVARHYALEGLTGRILAALEQSGLDAAKPSSEELAPLDEFHIGGRPATQHLADRLGFRAGDRLLDLGCGLGGAARFLAEHFDCHVTGLDLTPDYIEVARILAARTGAGNRVAFEVGSALATPFSDAAFDGAVTIHVAMNIEDRDGLYREAARVLKPGARFGIYDVMKGPSPGLSFPVPWSETAETSHLRTPEETRGHLSEAGFEVETVEDRSDFAKAFFRTMRERMAESGPPPLGLHILMGETFREKVANMMQNLEAGQITPCVMIARKA